MTFGELYTNFQTLIDKSGSPYFPQVQFDALANMKYGAWVDLEGKMIETTEGYMADLIYLYKVVTKANSTFIDKVVDTPNFRRRIRFNSGYTDCNNKAKNPNIRILSNATVDIAQNDPYLKGIDNDPACIATIVTGGNPGWQVFTETTPQSLNMTYLQNPQVIDSANNPNTVFEGEDYIAWILIQLVAYRFDITTENIGRAKAGLSDVSPQLVDR